VVAWTSPAPLKRVPHGQNAMGTWSAGILGNDTSFDVHESILEFYDAGGDVRSIAEHVRSRFRESLSLAQDANNVLFALALGLWELGALDDALRARVEELVSSGCDLGIWRELQASPTLIELRSKELASFIKRIQMPRKKPRARRRPPVQLETPFQPGTCLSFQFPDESFGGAVVAGAMFTKREGGMSLVMTNLKQAARPTMDDIVHSHFPTFRWEQPLGEAQRLATSNGMVARMSRKGFAYEKAEQRDKSLAACKGLFEVVGYLPPFHRVLYGSTSLGVNPGDADAQGLRERLAEALLANYSAAGGESPELATLADLLRR
jgi:hypothetical protein